MVAHLRCALRVSSRRLLAACALLAATGEGAFAQYFGRTKVQYERHDYKVVSTDHFDIHYYPSMREATADAARMAERWYARHAALLNATFERNALVFYADQPDFMQTNVIDEMLGEGTAGVTEGRRVRVAMPYTGVYSETDHVLGHELVHVFQYRIAAATPGRQANIGRVPLWFVEGMAEYLSAGRDDPNTVMWMRDAVLRNDLPSVADLSSSSRYFPYRYGQALLAYIGGEWGDAAIARLFTSSVAAGFEPSIASVLRVTPEELTSRWHEATRAAFPDVTTRTAPDSLGRAIITGEEGEHNVAPAVSPDGRFVAFFSSRSLFSIELYLADAQTGRVIRKLTESARDRHFDALSFISSAGAWSPDGRRLAVTVFAEGDTELHLIDVESGRAQAQIDIGGVGAISDPAWSPDGSRIAFSGSEGGISDIYVLDLSTEAVSRLTNDRYAQLQPAWSPDGRTIAFATDAGEETDFDVLKYGPVRLALIDVASRRVTLLPNPGGGKQINPQYSPDGASIYYIGNSDGVSDIYRLTLASNTHHRITRIATGVSGITALSPALSVSRAGDLVFSVFTAQGTAIRALSASAVAAAAGPPTPNPEGGILPPVAARATSAVSQALAAPTRGLPGPYDMEPRDYRPGIALEYVGGPNIGVGISSGYGAAVGGGVALGFSDMLGNHVVHGVINAPGDVRDIGADVAYINRSNRWAWGLEAYHVPLIGVAARAEPGDFVIDGSPAQGFIYTQRIERTYIDEALAMAQYPFSTTRRVELTAGIQRFGFDTQVDSFYVVQGTLIREARHHPGSGDPFVFSSVSAAFVMDYSFFGFTSPVSGARARFQATPVFGELQYTTLLVDYRRYFFARPFTLAVRGVHLQRIGADGESNRLRPYFTGHAPLVRGYEPTSFDFEECDAPAGATDQCPQFSRLSGSRIAVANVEIRVPLIGGGGLGLLDWPFLPVEVAPFVDAGVAWTADETPTLAFSRESQARVPVFAAGITTRLNLLGAAILEVYWAKPFQRPLRGSLWGFQVAPGW